MAGENRAPSPRAVARATPRVREHVDRLRAAGLDTARFFDALTLLRDDSALPKAHRDAIYKLIAMESFIWYLEALRNEPIDREKLLAQAKEIAAQPAIVKRTPGDQASALAQADIGKPGAAQPGATPTPPRAPPAPAARPAAGAAKPVSGAAKPVPAAPKPVPGAAKPPPAKK